MKFIFHPKSNLEKFGVKVYSALVENFSQTFFVGGMVRDLLISRKVEDIDIATEALPDDVVKILLNHKINVDSINKKFGSIVAKQGSLSVEITTLRLDLKSKDRYPQVMFIRNIMLDSTRRDFTINSLYLSLKTNKIFDFQLGLEDIKTGQIKFIGDAKFSIMEDPLRIVRALRFALILNFKLEKKTKEAIKKNFNLIEKLTRTKLEKEVLKIKNKNKKIILEKVINNPKILDKYFK